MLLADQGKGLFCSALVQPYHKSCVQFRAPKCEDIKLLQSIQKEATKIVKGLERKTYEEQLRSHGLLRPEKRMLRGAALISALL